MQSTFWSLNKRALNQLNLYERDLNPSRLNNPKKSLGQKLTDLWWVFIIFWFQYQNSTLSVHCKWNIEIGWQVVLVHSRKFNFMGVIYISEWYFACCYLSIPLKVNRESWWRSWFEVCLYICSKPLNACFS